MALTEKKHMLWPVNQTEEIDEGLTRQCLQIVDLGFRGKEGR